MEIEEYLNSLENNLMFGAGRWVADFSESFRNFKAGEHKFDLYMRGGVRPKGIFLSRLFAALTLPNYGVAFYALHVPEDGFDFDKILKTVEERSKNTGAQWTWLLLFRNGGFPERLVKRVEEFNEQWIGIALGDVSGGDFNASSNLLGRKALSLVRITK